VADRKRVIAVGVGSVGKLVCTRTKRQRVITTRAGLRARISLARLHLS
jgi:hypothetical protein